MSNKFPEPSIEAIQHSQKLIQFIQNLIHQNNGSIDFSQYMEAVLYTPKLGYYMSGTQRFSELNNPGDFTTAPQISSLFGYCMGNYLAQKLKNYSDQNLIELGAGTGKLALDILTFFKNNKLQFKTYFILELSPDSKQRQFNLLKKHFPDWIQNNKIQWLNHSPNTPFEGIIFGNEILDALPTSVYQIYKHQNKNQKKSQTSLLEKKVYWDNKLNHFNFKFNSNHLINLNNLNFPELENYISSQPNKLIFEYCHRLTPWLKNLTEHMTSGELLFIDYGDYELKYLIHPFKPEGTLRCYFQHHLHNDPFVYPGLQDITADVNFCHLSNAAKQSGFKKSTCQTQMEFLINNKIEHFIQSNQNNLTPKFSSQIRQLMMPDQMGERFKVFSACK